jgi:hypothetical protein
MRKLILMVGLIVVGIACGDAVGEMLDVPDAGAQPGDGSSMQYVGNSTQTFRGYRTLSADTGGTLHDEYGNDVRTGIFEYYAACQETFGAGHRTCEDAEIRFTTKIPQIEGLAWYGIGADCAIAGTGSVGTRRAVRANGDLVSTQCSSTESRGATLPIACCGPK